MFSENCIKQVISLNSSQKVRLLCFSCVEWYLFHGVLWETLRKIPFIGCKKSLTPPWNDSSLTWVTDGTHKQWCSAVVNNMIHKSSFFKLKLCNKEGFVMVNGKYIMVKCFIESCFALEAWAYCSLMNNRFFPKSFETWSL